LAWRIEQLGAIAASKGQAVTTERLQINALDLMDIPSQVLATVFEKARKELTYYPGVPELRELAGARENQIRAVETDAAWLFVHEYLRKHGVDGRPCGVLADPNKAAECTKCHEGWVDSATGLKRCECRLGTKVDAPKIPPRVEYALRQLGGEVKTGLQRIVECPVKYMGKLRERFNEAYQNAVVKDTMGDLAPSLYPLLGRIPERRAMRRIDEIAAAGQVMDRMQAASGERD
jgi:hypothetical protein